jgi:hypothetical protein
MEFTSLPSHLVRRENGHSFRVAPAAVDSRWSSSVLDRVPCLITKDLRAHYGCVNAIEFSNNGGHWIASGIKSYCLLTSSSYVIIDTTDLCTACSLVCMCVYVAHIGWHGSRLLEKLRTILAGGVV